MKADRFAIVLLALVVCCLGQATEQTSTAHQPEVIEHDSIGEDQLDDQPAR